MKVSQANLVLELIALAIFVATTAIAALFALALFTIIGSELFDLTDGAEISGPEVIAFTERGYAVVLLTVAVPAILAAFAILGIRLLLVRSESPPWLPEADPPG